VIANGGYDGLQCLTDIRELSGHVFNRTRGTIIFYLLGTGGAFDTFPAADVINTMAYSPYLSAIVMIDHENTPQATRDGRPTGGRRRGMGSFRRCAARCVAQWGGACRRGIACIRDGIWAVLS
jgi:hypothetical protein